MTDSHWFYRNKKISEVPENSFGFVYMIVNMLTGQKYIGRKYFYSTRRKSLTAKQKREGKKRRTRVTKESNWREYMGSSKTLLADIERLGKTNFEFKILIFGETKGQVNYLEMKMQFLHDVSINPAFYNDTIGSGKFASIKDPTLLFENIQENLDF
jgi:hypothetical protein